MGLSRQVAIVAAGRAAATASLFAVNALLARAWSLEEFGRFSGIWILGNTLVPLFLLGLPAALLYAMPRSADGEGRRLLAAQSSAVLLVSAAAAAAALWVVGALGSTGVTSSAIAFAPYVFALVAGGHVEAALVAAGRPSQQAWLAFAGAVAVTAVAALARISGWSVPQALWALSAAGVARLALAHLALAAAVGYPRQWSRRGLAPFLGYAAAVGLNDAAGSLSRSVDRLVVLALLGSAEVGLYHAGAIEVPVSLALAAVVTVLVPEISRLSAAGLQSEVARLFRDAVGHLALFVLPLFFFLFAHAERVIAVYLPSSYGRSEYVFRIFLLALPLRCAVYNPILVGTGRARWALYGALGDLAANALLGAAFALALRAILPEWALLGPAAAAVVSTYGQVAILVTAISRALGSSPGRLVPWGRIGRVGTSSLVAALASLAATGWLGPDEALASLALAAAVYGAALWALQTWLHREDGQEVRRLVRSVGLRGTP